MDTRISASMNVWLANQHFRKGIITSVSDGTFTIGISEAVGDMKMVS